MTSFLGGLNPFASRTLASVPPPQHQDAAGPSSSSTSISAHAPEPLKSPRTSFSLSQFLSPSMGSRVPPPMQRQASSTTTHSSCTTDSAASSRRAASREGFEAAGGQVNGAGSSTKGGSVAARDPASKQKVRKRKPPTETFVIVRPPPSNSKRPLNLQIQLVMNKTPAGVKGITSRSTSASSGLSMSTSVSGMLPSSPDDPEENPVESPVAVEHPRAETAEDGEQVVLVTEASPPVKSMSVTGESNPFAGTTPIQAAIPKSATMASVSVKQQAEKRGRQRASTSMTLKVFDPGSSRKRASTVAIESPAAPDAPDAALIRDEALSDAESSSSEPYQTISRSTSIVSSATSFASTSTGMGRMSLSSLGYGGSTNGSSKGGRRIVPMYNLAVHNLMTTVVTDAGTDTKVAKFQKRCVDITGIGTIEVVEHWSRSTNHFLTAHQQPLSAQSTRSLGYAAVDSMDGNTAGGVRGLTSGFRASMDANRLNLGSLFSGKNGAAPATIPEGSAASSLGASKAGNTRKLLGKFFGGNGGKRDTVTGSPAKRALGQSPVSSTFSDSTSSGVALSEALPYGAPTFGTAPVLANPHASVIPPTGSRPVRYTWTIKTWAPQKGGAADGEIQPAHPNGDPDQVTFEWIRGKSARRSQSTGCIRAAGDVDRTDTVSEGSAVSAAPIARKSARDADGTPSNRTPPLASAEKLRPTSMVCSFGPIDDGEDSDPEDSETPWTCVVRVPAGKAAIQSRRNAPDEEFRRIRYGTDGLLVGTMYPAPHHPRVVAQLKVPFELPTLMTGLAEIPAPGETSRPVNQIVLTEENVKDCLFVTALWLVAREEIAGIGRKKRA